MQSYADYLPISATWIVHCASFDPGFCSWAITPMLDPAIDRFKINVIARKLAKRYERAYTESTAEARNDREGFFSRARDRFTVTLYVSALHIPGPCPETIWIPSTNYHHRRFKVLGGRWSRIPNRIIRTLRNRRNRGDVRSRFRSTLGPRSSYRPMAGQILPSNLGRFFLTPETNPFPSRETLSSFNVRANRSEGCRYLKNEYQKSRPFVNGFVYSLNIWLVKYIKYFIGQKII